MGMKLHHAIGWTTGEMLDRVALNRPRRNFLFDEADCRGDAHAAIPPDAGRARKSGLQPLPVFRRAQCIANGALTVVAVQIDFACPLRIVHHSVLDFGLLLRSQQAPKATLSR
jgi:hypothetical protein